MKRFRFWGLMAALVLLTGRGTGKTEASPSVWTGEGVVWRSGYFAAMGLE